MEQLQNINAPNEYREAFDRLRTAKIWLWWLLLAAILINLTVAVTVRCTNILDRSESFRADQALANAPAASEPTAPAPAEKAPAPAPKAAAPVEKAPAPAEKAPVAPTEPKPATPAETAPAAPAQPKPAAPAKAAETQPAETDAAKTAEADEQGEDEAEDSATVADSAGAELFYLAMKPGLALLRAGGLFSALLLTLVILLSVKMCLLGRFPGISPMTSAMLWSLVLAVLAAPWDLAFPGFPIPGLLFGRSELIRMTGEVAWGAVEADWATSLLYWARFVGYPLLGLILLLTVQVQYARALRRLRGDLEEG